MEWVGLVRAKELAGGPIADAVVDEIVTRIQRTLHAGPVDGVLLSLHGALASPTIPDVDGHILEKVREVIGPGIPLVATLDLHANITCTMIQAADVLVGYHTFPHIDHESCGRRATRALENLIRHGPTHHVSAIKIPQIVNAKGFATTGELMQSLYERLQRAEVCDGVLSASLFMAQPWLDVPDLGWTLYQAYRGEHAPLDEEAIADECWSKREFNARSLPDPESIVSEALQSPLAPFAVSEGHDATNSGAPGDSTRLLAAMLKTSWPGAGALTYCIDANAVQQAYSAGQGATLRLLVGGVDDPFCDPLEFEVEVQNLGEVRFVHTGHAGHNLPVNMGRTAVVKSGDVTLLLAERKGLGSTPRLYEEAGLDPRRYKFVVAKSPEGFRHDYAEIAAGFLYCGAPGCAWECLQELPFSRVGRPLYPLDEFTNRHDAHWAWNIKR